jgi:hypothetical protein
MLDVVFYGNLPIDDSPVWTHHAGTFIENLAGGSDQRTVGGCLSSALPALTEDGLARIDCHVDGFRRRAGLDMALWVSPTAGRLSQELRAGKRTDRAGSIGVPPPVHHRFARLDLRTKGPREIDPAIRDSGRQRDKGR